MVDKQRNDLMSKQKERREKVAKAIAQAEKIAFDMENPIDRDKLLELIDEYDDMLPVSFYEAIKQLVPSVGKTPAASDSLQLHTRVSNIDLLVQSQRYRTLRAMVATGDMGAAIFTITDKHGNVDVEWLEEDELDEHLNDMQHWDPTPSRVLEDAIEDDDDFFRSHASHEYETRFGEIRLGCDAMSTGIWENGVCASPDRYPLSRHTKILLRIWQQMYDQLPYDEEWPVYERAQHILLGSLIYQRVMNEMSDCCYMIYIDI